VEFLPLTIDGQSVYVGPMRRLGAYVLDLCCLLPISLVSVWLANSSSPPVYASWLVAYFLIAWAYWVGFAATLGATPGKLAVGIRITKPNGSRIDWREALMRYIVSIVLGLAGNVVQVTGMAGISLAHYAAATNAGKLALRNASEPSWYAALAYSTLAWGIVDDLAILTNARKRALHDFIAGTVVIHKQFAEPARPADGGKLVQQGNGAVHR
jgi:uncharacterized RDD family membrane protein YckC